MRNLFLYLLFVFARLCPIYAQSLQIKSEVICAGAATLSNGSVVTIGQPFVGVMAATDGSASLSSGLLPTLLQIQRLPGLTWTNPVDISYGTLLSGTQLNATSSVPGSFVYSPTNGTVLNAGTNQLNVVFTPIDTNDYITVTASVQIIVVSNSASGTLYGPGFTWSRTNDFARGTSAYSITGNPNNDSSGNPTWFYEEAQGGSLASANPWFGQPRSPLIWSPTTSQWRAGTQDQEPAITAFVQAQADVNFTFASPVVRWQNPTRQGIFATISFGTDVVSDRRDSGSYGFELAVVQFRAADQTYQILWSTNRTTPHNGQVQGGSVVTLPLVFTDIGDSILFTSRIAIDAPLGGNGDAGWFDVASISEITPITNTCVPAPSGLVSWWPGEGNANDVIGRNNGTLQNGATFAPGLAGQGFSLPATGGYVLIPDSPNLGITNAISVDAWIRADSLPGVVGGTILAKHAPFGTIPQSSYEFVVLNTGQLFWQVYGAGNLARTMITSNAVITTNSFFHVAATFDTSSQVIKIYVNGIEQPGALVETNTIPSIFASTSPLVIGATFNSMQAIYAFFNGTIDEVHLFNRELTAAEVLLMYNAGGVGICTNICVPAPPNIVSWWPGEGNANDVIGTNNGTLQNGATFAPGLVGQAFSFNGTGGFVSGTLSQSLRVPQVTLATWFRLDRTNRTQALLALVPAGANLDGRGISLFTDAQLNVSKGNGAGPYQSLGSVSSLTTGVWHHAAATFDGAVLKLYLDGVLESVSNSPAPIAWSDAAGQYPTPGQFYLGAYRDNLPTPDSTSADTYFLSGLVDEPSVYSRALSSTEIASNYKAGSAGMCSFVQNNPILLANWGTNQSRTLSLIGQLGANYQLQFSTNLASGSWYQALNYTQTNAAITIGVDSSDKVIFYRLLRQ